MLIKALKSRTVWVSVAGLVIALLQAFQGYFSPETFSVIMIVATTLVGYFKLSPSQEY